MRESVEDRRPRRRLVEGPRMNALPEREPGHAVGERGVEEHHERARVRRANLPARGIAGNSAPGKDLRIVEVKIRLGKHAAAVVEGGVRDVRRSMPKWRMRLAAGVALGGFALLSGIPALALNIVGTNGNDTLSGTQRADRINGRAGNDRILGLGGNDVLTGGPGRGWFAAHPAAGRSIGFCVAREPGVVPAYLVDSAPSRPMSASTASPSGDVGERELSRTA